LAPISPKELADATTRNPVGPVKIALLGAGDLQLPAPQRAEAKCNSPDAVTLTLYCVSDERGEDQKAVSIELGTGMARDLAIRLWLAADEADFPLK
jgi:hypothetical protein